jgi:hypothetical protein
MPSSGRPQKPMAWLGGRGGLLGVFSVAWAPPASLIAGPRGCVVAALGVQRAPQPVRVSPGWPQENEVVVVSWMRTWQGPQWKAAQTGFTHTHAESPLSPCRGRKRSECVVSAPRSLPRAADACRFGGNLTGFSTGPRERRDSLRMPPVTTHANIANIANSIASVASRV